MFLKSRPERTMEDVGPHQGNRPASGQEFADAIDKLAVPRWTRVEAEAWWDEFGERVEKAIDPPSPAGTEKTLAIDVGARSLD